MTFCSAQSRRQNAQNAALLYRGWNMSPLNPIAAAHRNVILDYSTRQKEENHFFLGSFFVYTG